MENKNNDIEIIYKLLSGELSEQDEKTVLEEIRSSDVLKKEYLVQKELFNSFEQKGKDELILYLNANHNKYWLFGQLLKYKLLIGIATLVMIIGSALLIYNNYSIQVIPIQTMPKIGQEITVDEIPEDEITPTDTSIRQHRLSNKVHRSEREIESLISIDTSITVTEISNIKVKEFNYNKGEINISGISKKELNVMKIITFRNGLYLKHLDQVYKLDKSNYKQIKDVRTLRNFQFIKKAGKYINCNLKLFEKTKGDKIIIRRTISDSTLVRYSNDSIFITAESISSDLKLYKYSNSIYLEDGAEKYIFIEDGRSIKINQFPFSENSYIQRAIVYVMDLEKLESFNEQ